MFLLDIGVYQMATSMVRGTGATRMSTESIQNIYDITSYEKRC